MDITTSHPVRMLLQQMASYNGWATQRLYSHVDALPDADYRRDAGLFFKSVHGTLNHLLVGEHLLWYERFAHGASPKLALDAQVEPDRRALRQRLLDGAARWPVLLANWPDSRFDGELIYTRMTGEAVSLPFAAGLMHVFNHGTHHRAQITAALTAMGHVCPELDMVIMLQQQHREAKV
jgi:uncharacterized damage-inducible protein DinB